jgi:hypothetical protein
MRSVSPRVRRGGALLLLLAVLAVPTVYADEDGFPYEPPSARARPPGGVMDTSEATEEAGFFESLIDWFVLMARARPPIG